MSENPFDHELNRHLDAIRAQGLYRELRRVDSPQGTRLTIEGRSLKNFSSNDYLGLAEHPSLKEAAIQALQKFGSGSGASRLICGSLGPHFDLEETLADFKGTAAALSFSTGYAAALGAITALVGKEDVIVIDKLVHASIVDAARLSGATLRVFAHNDLDDLEKILRWADQKKSGPAPSVGKRPRTLVVTESVFSMDGDLASLKEIVALKDQYGAWLMLDEAHATGLFGTNRRGLAEAYDLAGRVEIQMGTLGKAAGASGGYICGSRPLVDLLINRARSFIFSTAPPPASSAAAAAGIRLIKSQEGEDRRSRLWANVDRLKNALIAARQPLGLVQSPIIPLMVGDETAAVKLAADLRENGIFIPAIRYPTVARGKARLRLTVSAAHSHDDVQCLLGALKILRKTESC